MGCDVAAVVVVVVDVEVEVVLLKELRTERMEGLASGPRSTSPAVVTASDTLRRLSGSPTIGVSKSISLLET